MHYESKLESQTVFSGKVIQVTRDIVSLENGSTSFREIVHHGGGAGIVAINSKGEIALVRQYRYALGTEIVEIPAGKVEQGEPPIETARRELGEETGCVANFLVPFSSVIATPGYCTEIIHIFLATGLSPTKQNLDADEFLDVFWVPLDDAYKQVMDGKITDSKSVSGIIRAKILLDQEEIQY